MHTGGRYIKDIIYGANDGIITTFAVVAGVAGADLSPAIVILLGAANLFADGFSMAASNYFGSKSERDFVRKEHDGVERDLADAPREEQNEMIALLQEQGYGKEDAPLLARLMFKNKEFFVDLMMHEELELSSHAREGIMRKAAATFIAFVGMGFIPIIPFLFLSSTAHLFAYSVGATGAALFLVGSLRSLVTKNSWIFSGLEMLVVGGIAASIAYVVGAFLKSAVGVF